MGARSLDRLLTAFSGCLHASSVCMIQDGWRLNFPAFDAVTIHVVLIGSGTVQVGDAAWQPFAPRSIIVVPPHRPHALGAPGADSRAVPGGDHCAPFGDGLAAFTGGDGQRDTLMVCGSVPRQDGQALGLVELLGGTVVEDLADIPSCRPMFDLMLAEVTEPAPGLLVMTEALMRQCLVLLLRRRLLHGEARLPPAMLEHPRLVNAVAAILRSPAAPHSLQNLAAAAGMGRTAFTEAFSRAFGQGPIAFVQEARLRAAARLLLTTDFPVKLVAASVGFASRSHFSRAFAVAFGADPSRFRAHGRSVAGGPALADSDRRA